MVHRRITGLRRTSVTGRAIEGIAAHLTDPLVTRYTVIVIVDSVCRGCMVTSCLLAGGTTVTRFTIVDDDTGTSVTLVAICRVNLGGCVVTLRNRRLAFGDVTRGAVLRSNIGVTCRTVARRIIWVTICSSMVHTGCTIQPGNGSLIAVTACTIQ